MPFRTINQNAALVPSPTSAPIRRLLKNVRKEMVSEMRDE